VRQRRIGRSAARPTRRFPLLFGIVALVTLLTTGSRAEVDLLPAKAVLLNVLSVAA